MIKQRRAQRVLVAIAVVAATGAWVGTRITPPDNSTALEATAVAPLDSAAVSGGVTGDSSRLASDRALLEADLAFYARRATEDRQSATDRATLAALYVQRARATGGFEDYARAESLATESLALRAVRNEGAVNVLATALLARHAFAEALALVSRADSLEPGQPGTVALLAEIELELGHYEAAHTHFASVRHEARRASVGARLARWYEVTGRGDLARGLLRRTVEGLEARDDLPREQVAWFHYRLGELAFRTGALDSAEASFRRGLDIWPDDYRILGAMARLEAARGDWARAIDLGEQAVVLHLDPVTLGVLSEAHAALGDSSQASDWRRAMRVSALSQPGPIHRAWGLFLLDHGTTRDAREILTRARRDLQVRRDVYGLDLLAWALHRSGRHAEAGEMMAAALAQGTEDPLLQYHAGIIHSAVGDSATARVHLTRALAAAPAFGARQTAHARAILDSLTVTSDE